MTNDAIWADLREYLADEFRVNDHGFDHLGVKFPDGTVGVRRRDDTIEVASPIRNVHKPDHAKALAVTSEYTHVSLCTMRGVLFVRQIIPLALATRDLLASALNETSRLGQTLGPAVSGAARGRTDVAFAHLAD